MSIFLHVHKKRKKYIYICNNKMIVLNFTIMIFTNKKIKSVVRKKHNKH